MLRMRRLILVSKKTWLFRILLYTLITSILLTAIYLSIGLFIS